jgi:large-conductance mechanosensitive channel
MADDVSVARSLGFAFGWLVMIGVAIIIFPLIAAVAVGTNYNGSADKLAGLPGIDGGGVKSSIVALIYAFVLWAIVMGALGVTDTSETASANNTHTPTPTSTTVAPTQTATPTPTPTPTPTATPSPTPTATVTDMVAQNEDDEDDSHAAELYVAKKAAEGMFDNKDDNTLTVNEEKARGWNKEGVGDDYDKNTQKVYDEPDKHVDNPESLGDDYDSDNKIPEKEDGDGDGILNGEDEDSPYYTGNSDSSSGDSSSGDGDWGDDDDDWGDGSWLH